jgi:hypothetical protein
MFLLDHIRELKEVIVNRSEEFGKGLRRRLALLFGIVAVAEDSVSAVIKVR